MSLSRIVQVGCVLLAISWSGFGQSRSGEPLAASQKLEEELKALDETPVGRKVAEINRKWSAAINQNEAIVQQCQQEFQELNQTSAYLDYAKKRKALAEKEDSSWQRERKAIAEKGQALYKARHEELKKLAVADLPEARKSGLNVLTYPRVDGSTSTQPLSVIIASRILDAPYEWSYPEPRGSPYYHRIRRPDEYFYEELYRASAKESDQEFTFADSLAMARPPKPGEERLAIMINSLLAASSSTYSAYVNLITRKCDLNLTARGPSAEEKALAQQEGVSIELKPIARDALVFIVNQQNSVKTISKKQIEDIYKGALTQWASLGGGWGSITAFWRERNSGSRELFDALVTPGHTLPDPGLRQKLFTDSMAGPFNRVSMEPKGIGYSVYYYEHFMALSPYTRTVAIDGIEPGPVSIASGKYPYTCDVFVAYRADQPKESAAMKLLAWLLSPEGQSVVRESGYVPVQGGQR